MTGINGAQAKAPRGGLEDTGQSAHGPNTAPESAVHERPDKSYHPCAGTMKNGQPCTMRTTLQTIEGGWRCRHHRDGLTVVGAGPLPVPPVTKLRTKADAERFLGWLTDAASRKMFNGAEVQALLRIVGMWTKQRQRMEEHVIDAYRALNAKAKELIRQLHAAREAWEDGDEALADRLEAEARATADQYDALNRERRALQEVQHAH